MAHVPRRPTPFRQISSARLAQLTPSVDGSIPLTVTTEVGSLYSLQVSTNLADWSDTITFTSTNRIMTFTQPGTNGLEFYRLQAPVNSPE